MQKNRIIFLVALIVFSILIRIPNLNRPLSKHHEFNVAMILNVCNSWDIHGGIIKNNFTPLINYGNAGDLYYGNHPMVFQQQIRYISFGSLQFVLPYVLFKVFPFFSKIIIIQCLGILCSLLAIIGLLKIFNVVRKKENDGTQYVISFFLFNAQVLWFFSNGFSHEVLAIPFYIWTSYYVIKKHLTNKLNNIEFAVLLALYFLGIWTDWFMLIVFSFHVLFLFFSNFKLNIKYVIATTLIIVLAIASMILSYGASTSLAFIKNGLMQKAQSRMPGDTAANYSNELLSFGFNLVQSIWVYVLVALFLVKKYVIKEIKLLSLFIIPALVYNLLLFRFASIHSYAFLKIIPFCVLICSLLWLQFKEQTNKGIANALFGIVLIIAVVQYYMINLPGKKSISGIAYNTEQKIGKWVREQVSKDDVVLFDISRYNSAAIIFYANRNIKSVTNETEAVGFAQQHGIKATFINEDSNGNLSKKVIDYKK